jgi:hypothetical protein
MHYSYTLQLGQEIDITHNFQYYPAVYKSTPANVIPLHNLQAESLVKAHDDLKTTTAHLGMTFLKLAKFEKDQSTCSSQRRRGTDINNFANAAVKVSRCQSRLDAEIVKHLVRRELE